MIKQPLESHD